MRSGVRNCQPVVGLPFHEVDHVDDARRADHGLVGEDGSHGLFDAELRLQRRQERLNLLPGNAKMWSLNCEQELKNTLRARSQVQPI